MPRMQHITKVMTTFFLNNNFEKSDVDLICPQLADLKSEVLTERFLTWLSVITNQKISTD